MVSYVEFMKFFGFFGFNKRRQNYEIIKSAFDKEFYLATYPAVSESGTDPIDHYLTYGSKQGYMPRNDFDPVFYIEKYLDVRDSGMDPFVHYIKHGRFEGRITLKYYDREESDENNGTAGGYRVAYNDSGGEYYRSSYQDVARAGVDRQIQNKSGAVPLLDSSSVSRSLSVLFEESWYLSRYPDVKKMRVDPLRHYLSRGAQEGRDPHPLFHTGFYLSQVKDHEAAAVDPLSHYVRVGAVLGLSPHPLFDRLWYRFGNRDVVENGLDEFIHFVQAGDRQGRSSHPLFDPVFYLRNNPDVAAAGIGPLRHFVELGGHERRNPHPMFDCQYYLWLHPELARQRINPLVHYLMEPRDARRHPHPLFDGVVQRLTSALARETAVDPLIDYVQFRSNLDSNLVLRHATYIPAPTSAILPLRASEQKPRAVTPLVSVIMPAYDSDERYFTAAVDSVRAQTYANWELIIVDDGSPMPHVKPMIEGVARLDRRIRQVRLDKNSGISEATNAGLRLAGGEFVAFVDHDDVLMHSAIEKMVCALIDAPGDAGYSDQAYVSAWNTFESGFYKPNWSPVLLSGVMYIGHLLVVRREVALAAGGFDPKFDRLQDFEFMLRVGEHTRRIVHVPKILYHWRSIPGSIAHDANSKGKIEPLQAAAVNAHFARIGFQGEAQPYQHLPHRLAIRPKPRATYPTVDVLVRGDRCKEATVRWTELLNERRQDFASVIVLAAKSKPKQRDAWTVTLATASPVVAELQRAIFASSGRYVVFIDPLVKVMDEKWLDHLLLYAELADVGFVAPHLYRDDGQVVAAGLLIGKHGLLPAMKRFKLGDDGFAGSLACNREVSALPTGMIMMDRTILDGLGGFDPDFSTPLYIFGDAAVRGTSMGYRNIAIAAPILRVDDTYDLLEPDTASDAILFQDIHADLIQKGDPFYNINFLEGPEDYIA